jgi:hypothetical protein
MIALHTGATASNQRPSIVVNSGATREGVVFPARADTLTSRGPSFFHSILLEFHVAHVAQGRV